MPIIRQLSPSVVNKIAAGEVIERPASVVKELLENAVDAGATRIDVTVVGGGSELVRVVDNGCGITADQLPLAVAPHATSKIQDADDLFRVGTLGFRGEALASIAEVSKLMMRSRPADADAGAELVVVGGRPEEVQPCGCPVGTSIEVHHLFFNTPVRRKFLRTAQTEMGHAGEALTRVALAQPHIHFTLRQQEKTVYDLPPTEDWPRRIAAFFGDELADALIPVESQDGPVKLVGYAAHPNHTRSHPRMQYVFLNGRAIRDRALQHALSEAYRGLVLTGRYPVAFLRIEMPADAVDVNVHPTKLEVRFQDSGRIYSQLLSTLRTKFLTADLTAKLQPTTATSPFGDPHLAIDEQHAAKKREELVAWAKGEFAARGPAFPTVPSAEPTATPPTFPQFDEPWLQRKPLEIVRIDRPVSLAHDSSVVVAPIAAAAESRPPQFVPQPSQPSPASEHHAPSVATPSHTIHPPAPRGAMQVHNRYLVAESEEGLVVIDQHALHERVLYEQLRQRVLAGALESQRLLVPEAVDLSPAEAAAATSNAELLGQLGVEVSAFGGDTILVTSYPAMLANFRPAEVLRDLVSQLVAGGTTIERRDLLDELLHMIACKAAIKAGDRLSPEEVSALVELRHLAQDSHHCPHGRPTVLVFSRDDLDRQFMRT
ncbi:MAG: DNA mismatch repair endonuclease MutL [Pirellulales bacterium]|nr:DNA mismatch repair endonuclease MutL [Pirellulales bacterium]